MTSLRATALTAVFLLIPLGLRAQVDPSVGTARGGAHEFGVTPVAFMSNTKFNIVRNGQEFKNQPFGRSGQGVAVDYLYNFTGFLAAGLEWLYVARNGVNVPGFWPDSSTKTLGDSHLVLATLRLRTPSVGRLRGYVIGGAGGHQTQFDLVTTPNIGTPWPDNNGTEGRPWIRSREKGLAVTARAGLEFKVSNAGLLGLEGGYVYMSPKTHPTKVPGAGGASEVRVSGSGFLLGARFGVRFGS